jgi:hypothetical protein
LGHSVLFNICFVAALAYLKPLGKAQAVVSEEALQEKHANRTGETMVVKLSSHPVSKGKSIAESASEARAGEIVRRSSVSSAGSLSDRLEATTAANSRKARRAWFFRLNLSL